MGVMAVYSLSTKNSHTQTVHSSSRKDITSIRDELKVSPRTGRRLFYYPTIDQDSDPPVMTDGGNSSSGGGDDGDDCKAPRGHHEGYNDSCSFVLDKCSGEWVLFNYLRFILCDMRHVQVSSIYHIRRLPCMSCTFLFSFIVVGIHHFRSVAALSHLSVGYNCKLLPPSTCTYTHTHTDVHVVFFPSAG